MKRDGAIQFFTFATLAWQQKLHGLRIPNGSMAAHRKLLLQEIDFATLHSWADNWLDSSTAWQARWIQQHDADAQQVLKKPASSNLTRPLRVPNPCSLRAFLD